MVYANGHLGQRVLDLRVTDLMPTSGQKLRGSDKSNEGVTHALKIVGRLERSWVKPPYCECFVAWYCNNSPARLIQAFCFFFL